jgi:protein tyrosine phosphatase (PTP) superfamily phosphohydrolase (DUF442 family)
MAAKTARRWIVRGLALLALLLGLGIGWRLYTANFGVIVPERLYRSAQMKPQTLAETLRDRRVKTVLNLRGANPREHWYQQELETTLAAGATQVDVAMSSCEWMSRAQLRAVVEVLEKSEYPLLIHCQHGAERTGLVSAFAELLRPGRAYEDARKQFTAWYLFLPVKDGKVMLEHLEQYRDWLQARGKGHSPEQFKEWVKDGFRPGKPNREDWPYDPYPLVVVTRPPALETVRHGSEAAAVAVGSAAGDAEAKGRR